MARSNLPNSKTGAKKAVPDIKKSKLNKNLGVYTFIDEDGNVTQIKKEKKSRQKYYPNEPSAVETVIGEIYVIGVTDDIAMGIGDNVMAYAQYL
jgi:hypothetical protein